MYFYNWSLLTLTLRTLSVKDEVSREVTNKQISSQIRVLKLVLLNNILSEILVFCVLIYFYFQEYLFIRSYWFICDSLLVTRSDQSWL